MNDIVIQALTEYLIETPEPDAFWWPEHWFVEVSTSRWIAGELINAILDHPMTPAEDTMEELAIKMTAYHADSDGTNAERIFSIAELLITFPQKLFDAVSSADVGAQLNQGRHSLISDSVGMLGIAGHLDGHGLIVVGRTGDAVYPDGVTLFVGAT